MTWTSTSNTDRTKPLAGQTLIDPDDGEIDEGDEWAGEEVDDKVEEIEYVIDENDEPTLTRDNADDVAWDMDVVDEEDAEDELEENEDIWDDDDVAAQMSFESRSMISHRDFTDLDLNFGTDSDTLNVKKKVQKKPIPNQF